MTIAFVDATKSRGLGRMVNDGCGREINCKAQLVDDHLCLFATEDLPIGAELRYDYGIPNLPWRKKTVSTKSKDLEDPFPQLTFCGLIKDHEDVMSGTSIATAPGLPVPNLKEQVSTLRQNNDTDDKPVSKDDSNDIASEIIEGT
ncbi:uncharacterized protein LOC119722067 isoform X2 [Patiria miniata]|uniref:SET domain-containing protein n=1 Tax=Patiria miniata TaxID=46514 RepID=A0A913Z8K1_PATMI|nr:uncharacterized protein LOC119722067 isoform X2 [Patiria miniata]